MLIADWVASKCVSALLLELSVTPKPGLVDRRADFPETFFEHFLASASALHPWFRKAAELGSGRGLGEIIYGGVIEMLSAQRGGNTHLGSLLLLAPLSAAAGKSKTAPIPLNLLRRNVKRVLGSMGWKDSVWVFRAVAQASPRGLGRIPFLNVENEETYLELERLKLSPVEAFKPFTEREMIAREWVSGYEGVFYGAGRLRKNLGTMPLKEALPQTFLQLLSRCPDTHIARRGGRALAARVSHLASEALKLGGMRTEEGMKAIEELDTKLRRSWKTRPGATADLLSASIAVLLLSGWKP